MAKKTPAKKTAVKPLKKAPAKKISKPAPKPSAKKPVKATSKPQPKKASSKSQVKKSPAKKISKPAPKSSVKKPVKAPSKPQIKKAPVKVAKKIAVKSSPKAAKASKKAVPAKKVSDNTDRVLAQKFVRKPAASKITLTPFLVRQRQRLLELKDTLLDSMRGVARDNLHAGSETSAFGMHQADAGSDAYDRDFALSMLSKEQGSLYEIDEALKRIEDGSYGVCDICEKPIRHDRLEALPFTRYTVECQAELEKRQHHHSVRPHINSLFGLTEEEAESEEEESTDNS